jgi:UPF0271 protein
MAARDRSLAAAIARAAAVFDRRLILVGPPDSELLAAGRAAGLSVAAEGFADRAYEPDGRLMSRSESGAVIDDAERVVARAVQMASEESVDAWNGARVAVRVATLCIHSDTAGADQLAARVRFALEGAGVSVRALGQR